jgi:hypothetical protein
MTEPPAHLFGWDDSQRRAFEAHLRDANAAASALAEQISRACMAAGARVAAEVMRLPAGGQPCGKFVYWWDGEYEGNCELADSHDGPHFDGLSWYDDDLDEVDPPGDIPPAIAQ